MIWLITIYFVLYEKLCRKHNRLMNETILIGLAVIFNCELSFYTFSIENWKNNPTVCQVLVSCWYWLSQYPCIRIQIKFLYLLICYAYTVYHYFRVFFSFIKSSSRLCGSSRGTESLIILVWVPWLHWFTLISVSMWYIIGCLIFSNDNLTIKLLIQLVQDPLVFSHYGIDKLFKISTNNWVPNMKSRYGRWKILTDFYLYVYIPF